VSNNSVLIGAFAENLALTFLEEKGLTLIEKNFETRDVLGKKSGEIDLIMSEREFTVFVEVKARENTDFGDALEMVTRQKQARIMRTAIQYLMSRNQLNSTYARFDVIGILLDKNAPNKHLITWIPNAFQVQ
jgi:putative endonuclease